MSAARWQPVRAAMMVAPGEMELKLWAGMVSTVPSGDAPMLAGDRAEVLVGRRSPRGGGGVMVLVSMPPHLSSVP